ncbi:uncharacterized protein LOC120126781, partial [Hibiscus syriacus]|uniref:uncharacterized protein LOC120126781 n=1 Tax=Hibiscus syriacus TaxID=106335 RepID=UPI001924CB71
VISSDPDYLKSLLNYNLPTEVAADLIKPITNEEIKLTVLLPNIISLNQTAFVKGRSIIDNTLLAQELVKDYGRKIISPRCALKIDLQKAFDSLHWDFLLSILHAIGLPFIFIKWTEACFREARYSISFNGSLIGYFKGQRDDLLIFYKGNMESIVGVMTMLNHFYDLSGLKLNAIYPSLKKLLNVLNNWKGSDIAASVARNSWDKICCPKSEGGLGLKNISSWNKTCMVHLIRKLLVGQRSLWVAWIHCYVIKSKNFNEINECPSYSWCFRKLIRLRSEASPLLLNSGLKRTRDLCEELRVHKTKVLWHRIVWFPLHIPKLNIISWMAILDRLPTRNRLIKMGIASDELCILCNEIPENRNHLFVHCTYATSLWNTILSLTSLSNIHNTWESRINWVVLEWKGKSLLIIILKLAWTAFIYSV